MAIKKEMFGELKNYIMGCLDSVKIIAKTASKAYLDTETIAEHILAEVFSELNKMIGEGIEKVDSTSVTEDEFYFPVNCIWQYMVPSDIFVIKCMFYGEDKTDFEFETSAHDFEEDMEKYNINPIEYEVVAILTNEKKQIVFEIEKLQKIIK